MRGVFSFILFVFMGIGMLSPAYAEEYAKVGDLEIGHPWARATSAKARNGAVYLMVSNNGEKMDKMIGVATDVAKTASMHAIVKEHVMPGTKSKESGAVSPGMMIKMEPVESIEVHPGEPVVLQPGGLHIMLMGLKRPLKEGESFPLTLTFEKAGSVDVNVVVQKAGAMMPGMHHDMNEDGDDHHKKHHGNS